MNYMILSAYAQNNKLDYNALCAAVHSAQGVAGLELKTQAQRDLLYWLESTGAPDEQIARMLALIAESNDTHTRHMDLLQDVLEARGLLGGPVQPLAKMVGSRLPPRDREKDRACYPDPAFNDWLDDVVADGGATVWHMVSNTDSAHDGWRARGYRSVGNHGETYETLNSIRQHLDKYDTPQGDQALAETLDKLETAADLMDRIWARPLEKTVEGYLAEWKGGLCTEQEAVAGIRKTMGLPATPGDTVEWHPIATAPRSGDILIYCEETKEQFVAYWHEKIERWVYAFFTNALGIAGTVACPNPTHWRPVPANPGSPEATVVPPLVHIANADERAGRWYVAGPMTGIPEWNFPAFNAAAAKLRAEGLDVVNPADHGLVEGADWADYLRYDVSKLAACEGIALLPGWSKSKGAKLEFHIARVLGMQIRPIDGAEAPPCDDDAALRQQSEAWHAVWALLKDLVPGFHDRGPDVTGQQAALDAIRGLRNAS